MRRKRNTDTGAIKRSISRKANKSAGAVGTISDKTDQWRHQAERRLEETKKNFAEAEGKIRGYIKSNPEKALMIAAGVGVAVGAIMSTFFRGTKVVKR